MSAIAKSPRRGLIVLGLLVATLAVGALALPALDDMGDVGIIEFELARTSEKASEYYGELGESGRDAARESLYLDYPYLILYGLFYAAACLVVAARAAERGIGPPGGAGAGRWRWARSPPPRATRSRTRRCCRCSTATPTSRGRGSRSPSRRSSSC